MNEADRLESGFVEAFKILVGLPRHYSDKGLASRFQMWAHLLRDCFSAFEVDSSMMANGPTAALRVQ